MDAKKITTKFGAVGAYLLVSIIAFSFISSFAGIITLICMCAFN